jgi:exodeoxyribonuclease VIII
MVEIEESKMKVEPGIYPGVPFDEYAKWDAVNNSLLNLIISHSPAHAKEYRDNPPPKSDAFQYGEAWHCHALEPNEFNKRYAIAPVCDKRTKDGKAIWSKFQESINGKKVIEAKDYLQMQLMTEAIKKQIIYRFIQGGEAEVCIVWIEKRTGLLCKARLDYVHRNQAIIIDLKSTRDASKEAFSKAIYNYGYYQQGAWYSDGWQTLIGDPPAFTFLAVEKSPPYCPAAYELGAKDIIAGRLAYRKALKIYAECMATDTWPGYPDEVRMISMPDWALNQAGVSQYNLLSEDEIDG